jgi:hypothetical protein
MGSPVDPGPSVETYRLGRGTVRRRCAPFSTRSTRFSGAGVSGNGLASTSVAGTAPGGAGFEAPLDESFERRGARSSP